MCIYIYGVCCICIYVCVHIYIYLCHRAIHQDTKPEFDFGQEKRKAMDVEFSGANYFGGNYDASSISSTHLGLLKVYGTNIRRLNIIQQSSETPIKNSATQVLSANAAMKLARARLLKLNSQKDDILSVLSSNESAKLDTSSGEIEDTELALLLQAAAQFIAKKRFVSARKLLSRCQAYASKSGSPCQRTVDCFADALQERIDKEWGMSSQEGIGEETRVPIDVRQTLIHLEPKLMEVQQHFPVPVISQFTAIQSLIDTFALEKRVHVIDFGIKNGSHWIILMQALAARFVPRLELLTITVIGTSKTIMDETAKRLASFAEAMNLPLKFNIIVSALKDVKEDMFKLQDGEAVAIYSSLVLWTVLAWPSHLESLLRLFKKLKPRVMLLNETEASINSPDFFERFTHAVLYYSALFDCIAHTIKDHPFRKISEEVNLRAMVRNTVVREGHERYVRQEKVSAWRKLFAKMDIVETDLSSGSLSQASYLLQTFGYGSHLSLEMDGKCLIAAWDGTPMESVSAWKFL